MQIKKLLLLFCREAQWPSGLEHWTGDRMLMGSNPAVATSLRNFGNSVYRTLPVSFGGDTKNPSIWCLCQGEVKDPTSPHWKCVT